jgi:hypothetical protein
MRALNKTQWLILNATADDYEDLEQIYRAICLEFSPERYNPLDPTSFYWREAKDRVPLSEIVDNLRSLANGDLLAVRSADGSVPAGTTNDVSYLWQSWFRITPKGREILASSEWK